MKGTPPGNSKARGLAVDITLARGAGWGFIGGLIATLVMDLFLMGAFSVAGLPALTCFSIVGDTVARFFTILGIEIAGGVPLGIAVHYIIGPAIGASFGLVAARADTFKANTSKKSIVLAVMYVEVLSQPLLAAMPVLLGWGLDDTLQWYGGALCAHMIAGAVLGFIVHWGLGESTKLDAAKLQEDR